eukprot:1180609-Prorocentrum_minimum.AAC.1
MGSPRSTVSAACRAARLGSTGLPSPSPSLSTGFSLTGALPGFSRNSFSIFPSHTRRPTLIWLKGMKPNRLSSSAVFTSRPPALDPVTTAGTCPPSPPQARRQACQREPPLTPPSGHVA